MTYRNPTTAFIAIAAFTIAMFSADYAFAQTPPADTGHKPRWTYEEIVNDGEFQQEGTSLQLAILLFYFAQKSGFISAKDLCFNRPIASGLRIKYCFVPSQSEDLDLNSYILLNFVLSPQFLKYFKNDAEFREFLPQYCKYYMPHIEGIVSPDSDFHEDRWRLFVNLREDNPDIDYFNNELSLDVLRVIARMAPEECGETIAKGWMLSGNNFRLVFSTRNSGKEDQHGL